MAEQRVNTDTQSRNRIQRLLLWGLPLLLLALCLASRPFSQTLITRTLSIHTLSTAQRTNLRVAIRPLDGWVLQPGERFSFNRVVGPRTARRGYVLAPSYLGGESPATLGGGICLLSSALYQLALAANMRINSRTAHLRTIHSVPPGLDATVWYGGADLQFTNTLSMPVQLSAQLDSTGLKLVLRGAHPVQSVAIRRIIHHQAAGNVQVVVMQGSKTVSNDLYRLSP